MTNLAEYDFPLPPERIAQEPVTPRDSARLLVYRERGERIRHLRFRDLPDLLEPEDVLVLNDVRVLPVRLTAARAPSGGRVDLLLLRTDPPIEALLQARGRLQPGQRLQVGEGALDLRLTRPGERGRWELEVTAGDLLKTVAAVGRAPLPPYVRRPRLEDPRRQQDLDRYQTVYAAGGSAVAAPTAGLHFTTELLDRIAAKGVTLRRLRLHIGPGTFLPVRAESIEDHTMEAETYEIPELTARAVTEARGRGGRVVAVGTTCVRALESAATAEGGVAAGPGSADIFIHPPYRFRAVDDILTNFHLPRGTPLLLVAARIGRRRLLDIYEEASRLDYRFFSYGDAMMVSGR